MVAVRAAVALRANTRNPSAYCVESPALPDAVNSGTSSLILMIGYNPIVRIKILDYSITSPPHKTPPSVRGGPAAMARGPYTRPALSAHTTHHTFPQAYTTRYPASPNHAHYS